VAAAPLLTYLAPRPCRGPGGTGEGNEGDRNDDDEDEMVLDSGW